ncbi:hypothetical protein SDRG_01063 [Saprolegnia diclina VS20]|uniref:UDENN domain-containing protein n=1 Tax=Saprolegnia diclina (strain VS20) TaxID=1156394 RepID=T0R5L0_SAPDV|nr:hypothetical protein SDRG_01063 [Saprolegnia diclina VS20]EQC42226.1 hypothetical protein SDRG_01063 [Saprolegnia diclina VS20]|eukprot:XP_008604795.1 hypothetical protein SDRG_01063 [Saprolegnia diclina VS20]
MDDDDGKRSLFSGMRVRSMTPTKAPRSPARNFRDMWTGARSGEAKPPKAKRQWFFDSEAAKEPLEASIVTETGDDDDENDGLRGHSAQAFQLVESWCKANDVAFPIAEKSSRREMQMALDLMLASIDEQDNQLSSEILELDAKVQTVRRPSARHGLPSPFQIRLPETDTSSVSHGGCPILDTLVIVGPDVTDIAICPSLLETVFEPVVCATYPRPAQFESLQHFCFPNGIRVLSDADDESLAPSFFLFVLSGGGDVGQDMHYASCLVRWLPLPKDVALQPHALSVHVPIAYCVVSKLPCWSFYKPLLQHLHDLHDAELVDAPHLWHDLSTVVPPKLEHLLSSKLGQFTELLVPPPGHVLDVPLFESNARLHLKRPAHRRSLAHFGHKEECTGLLLQWALPIVLDCVSIDTFLIAWTSLMLEAKVVVVCDDLEVLTSTVLGLVSLLSPLTWAGPVIAVLPTTLLEYLEAPVPFLIGVQELPTRFHDIPGLVRVYPLDDCVLWDEPETLPQHDMLADELGAVVGVHEPWTASAVDSFAHQIYAVVQSLLEPLEPTSPHAIATQIQSTQMYQILLEKRSAHRHLPVLLDPVSEPNNNYNHSNHTTNNHTSIDNQDEVHWSASLDACTAGIMHLALHGAYAPPSIEPGPSMSALDRLRGLCAREEPKHVTVVIKNVVALPSPKPKPVSVSHSINISSNSSSSSHKAPITQAPKTHRSASPIKEHFKPRDIAPKPDDPAPMKRRPSKSSPFVASEVALELESTRVADEASLQRVPSVRETEIEALEPPRLSRDESIQHIQRWWRRRKPSVPTPVAPSVPRCTPAPVKPSLSRRFSAPLVSTGHTPLFCTPFNTQSAIALLLEGVAVLKLSRRRHHWNKRWLFCDFSGEHLFWEKTESRSKTTTKAPMRVNDILEVAVGADRKPSTYLRTVNTLFATTSVETELLVSPTGERLPPDDLCITLHTTLDDSALVFKFESKEVYDRVLVGLQALYKQQHSAPPRDHDITTSSDRFSTRSSEPIDDERATLERFLLDLKRGFCIKKHGRQGAPHTRMLRCDAEVKIVSCIEMEGSSPMKPHPWRSRKDKTKKTILPIDTISDVHLKDGHSPLRNLLYGRVECIAIVSSVKTLVVSTESSADLARLLDGFQLLIKYYGTHTVGTNTGTKASV